MAPKMESGAGANGTPIQRASKIDQTLGAIRLKVRQKA